MGFAGLSRDYRPTALGGVGRFRAQSLKFLSSARRFVRLGDYDAFRVCRAIRPMQIPVGLEPHPEMRRHLEQARQAQGGVGSDAALAEHDLVQSVERNAEATRHRVSAYRTWPRRGCFA